MGQDMDAGIAAGELDQLHSVLKNTIATKFDNKSVMWIIKAWTKVGIRLRDRNYHKFFQMYLVRRTPTPPLTGSLKRSQVLLRELGGLSDAVNRQGRVPNDQVWSTVHLSMVYFVQDYWKATVSQTDPRASEENFSQQLRAWSSKSAEDVMAELIFQSEQHL
jgi:hypothetical protein